MKKAQSSRAAYDNQQLPRKQLRHKIGNLYRVAERFVHPRLILELVFDRIEIN
jgi:hypothetical protein